MVEAVGSRKTQSVSRRDTETHHTSVHHTCVHPQPYALTTRAMISYTLVWKSWTCKASSPICLDICRAFHHLRPSFLTTGPGRGPSPFVFVAPSPSAEMYPRSSASIDSLCTRPINSRRDDTTREILMLHHQSV